MILNVVFNHIGIAFSDGPLVAGQRQFAIKSLKNFGMGTRVIEHSIRTEVTEVLECIEAECTEKPVQVEGMFVVPVMNALWSLFMGKRYDHKDPEIHRLANGVKAYVEVKLIVHLIA